MEVSVVIPVFNAEATIARSIQSILDQEGFKVKEIIVIDDGSTDNSNSIVNKLFEGMESFTLISQENRGVSAARNRGIDLAQSEYIALLDADDTFESTFIIKAITMLEGQKQTAFVTAGCNRWVAGRLLYSWIPEKPTLEKCLLENVTLACGLFRKEVLKVVGGYDESMLVGYEDWDLNIRLLARGYELGILQEPLINYYNTAHSRTKTAVLEEESIRLYLLEKYKDLYIKHLPVLMQSYAFQKEKTAREIAKVKKGRDYRLGHSILTPLRKIKFFLNVFNR